MNTKTYNRNTTNFLLPVIIVVLMFSVELTAYIQRWIDKSLASILLYQIVIVCMLFFAAKRKREINTNNLIWPILYFYLLLLFIRLVIDFVIPGKGFFLYKTANTILFFYCCPILIPSIFFRQYRFDFDVKSVAFIIGVILLLCVVSSLNDILSGHAIQDNDGRYRTAIFSIGFGQYSTTLFIIGCYLVKVLTGFKLSRIIALIFTVVGVTGVIFSGSRGPFITTITCFVVFILSQVKNTKRLIIVVIIIMLIIPLAGDVLIDINNYMRSNGIYAFDRVIRSLFEENGLTNHSSGRDNLYKEAWELFMNNPLLGHSYLIPGKIYAHNIIVEQFMATGLFGGLAFLIVNIWGLIKGFKLMRRDLTFAIVPLLYLQYFIYGCLSVTILALFPYWLFLLLTINKSDTVSIYEQRKTFGKYNNSNI